MKPIRVLVADMPPLDSDIVERIVGELPDMLIVGKVEGPVQAAEALAATEPDVVLCSASLDEFYKYLRFVWDRPRLGVVVIDPDYRHRSVARMRMSGQSEQTWPESVAAAIRWTAG
jgi:chemotaxis response regulator CheB